MKCENCQHHYRKMTNSIGYNPVPFCHLHEDTRNHPDPLRKTCFEPRETMKEFQMRVFGKPVIRYDETFRYQLLERLVTDCKYFLGYGNRQEKCLWAGNVQDHIIAMQVLWRSFPYDKKPEWLTWDQISEYATHMKEGTA